MTVSDFPTVKLLYPIEVAGEQCSALTIKRRANLGDMREASKGGTEIDSIAILLSRLYGITRSEADSLDAEDSNALIVAMSPFAGNGRRTGGR